MCQRLNIEIKKGNKVLANSYYHWSAYSSISCDMAIDIMKFMNDYPQKNINDILYAIRLLEHTGAGLTDFNSSELETAQNMFPNESFQKCNGRNDGLLSITHEGMEETRYWEERRVTIDIGSKCVKFDVYFEYYNDDYLDEQPSQVADLELDLENLTYQNLLKLKEVLKYYEDCDYDMGFKLKNGKIIGFIE